MFLQKKNEKYYDVDTPLIWTMKRLTPKIRPYRWMSQLPQKQVTISSFLGGLIQDSRMTDKQALTPDNYIYSVGLAFCNGLNTFHVTGKFSRQQTHIFSYFSLKTDLTLHANCLQPWETICMKCQILFSRKNRIFFFQNVVCWNFYPVCKVLKKLTAYYFQFCRSTQNATRFLCSIFNELTINIAEELTHCSRETRKRVLGKQCRPRSDAAERGVWSGSPLFANSLAIFLQEYLNLIAWPT